MIRTLLLLLGFLSISMVSHAQDYQLSGTVIDMQGEALPGVNIVKKGTTVGTTSNSIGQFEIEVQASDTLVFSFIGYETQMIHVQGRKTLDVTMNASTNEMTDAVVTALGLNQVKEKIGYSTQEIETESISNANAQNLGNLFTGKVAGLSVDNSTGMFQSAKFSLRGKEPLIVVDDIPVDSDLFDISKNDIKEINVLKGTSASALYGARGKDGAILITTKNAEGQGLDINISTSTMVSAGYTVFPEAQKEYGNGSNGQYEFWDGKDGGIADGDGPQV